MERLFCFLLTAHPLQTAHYLLISGGQRKPRGGHALYHHV